MDSGCVPHMHSLPRGYVNNWNPGGLNDPITEAEVKHAIKMANNNKACSIDELINEFFKTSLDLMTPIYVKLFNLIFNTGVIPVNWTIGLIKPIYKKKDNKEKPENYRGITLLSCFSKLVTCILNQRIKSYIDKYEILGEDQAGFRNGYSTVDNIFVFKSIIDIYLSKHKKLYCAFIDYRSAFDKIKRPELWQKPSQML